MLIMKAFKGWVTGSGVALSTVEINEWLPKKYYVIAGKTLMSGMCKLSIRPDLFHVRFSSLPKLTMLVARKIKKPR